MEAAHRDHQRANHCPHIPREEWDDHGGPPPTWGACNENGEGRADDCHHCPGAYAREPAAVEARRALEWWDTGQLGHLYPDGVPEVVCEAIDVARGVRAAWRREGVRQTKPKDKT